MNPLFSQALKRLSLYLVIGLLVGNEFDNMALGIAIVLAAYVGSMLFNYRNFQRWLDEGAPERKPVTNNFWDGITDGIYRIVSGYRHKVSTLEDDLDFFRDSFQALDSALVVINTQGSIDWANRAATSMLGIDIERDRGELLVNLLRAPKFSSFLAQKKFAEVLVVESPRNPALTLEVQVMPFRSEYLLIFVRDISELVMLERVRQDFIANVSHELRTPLTVIKGYLETLQDNSSKLPATWARVFDQMQEQSQRLEAMVTDLVWLSRLESLPETEQGEPVPVLELLRALVDDSRVSAEDRQIELHIDEACSAADEQGSVCVLGNYDELRSAFANLLQNAVKYTASDGRIDVYCQWSGDALTVRVSDDGEGIDPVHIPRLTERFYRADASRNSSTGGTGLGLAIVKHVLNRHDARLLIRSQPGKGSHFSCIFPEDRVNL